ncbi:MAG: hypothetical protein N4A63_12070 [Vallitalea sp.]|jgi:hypothetical protein|nr:hypothetical protein [Vallitalea sp.]
MIENYYKYYSLEDIPKPFLPSYNEHIKNQNDNDMIFILLLTLLLADNDSCTFDIKIIDKIIEFMQS